MAPNAVPVFWMCIQNRHGFGPRRGQRPRATCGCSAAAAPTVRGSSTWRRVARIIASPPRRRRHLYSCCPCAAHWRNGPPEVPKGLPEASCECREAAPVGRSDAGSPIGLPWPCVRKVAPCIYGQSLKRPPQPVIFGAMSLAVRVTCLEALGILLYSICALAKMEGLAAISLQIDVVPDFNLNGERIRWVTEQSIRTSVSRPGTRIREVPWVTWKRSRNSWSGGHPLLSFCSSIDSSWDQTRFLVSYMPLARYAWPVFRGSEPLRCKTTMERDK